MGENRNCLECIHYKSCRDWYGHEDGMPNYAVDIECRNYEETQNYILQSKQERISHALESIKAEGFQAELLNYDNAHIRAISKHGKRISYYATTGTIVGYADTNIQGVDEFIRLLKTI